MASFDPILKSTFKLEGDYQALKNDKGNYNRNHQLVGTKLGISAVAWEAYFHRTATVADMKAITPELAAKIYKFLFWQPIQGDYIKNQSVARLCFDTFVNHGNNGLKYIRMAVNAVLGQKLIAETARKLEKGHATMINGLNQKQFHDKLKAIQLASYEQSVKQNPSKKSFLTNWKNRLQELVFAPDSGEGQTASAGSYSSAAI
jgi:lysozyme family protein